MRRQSFVTHQTEPKVTTAKNYKALVSIVYTDKTNKHMKETKNTKKTNEQKATTKLPKSKQLINKEKHKKKWY